MDHIAFFASHSFLLEFQNHKKFQVSQNNYRRQSEEPAILTSTLLICMRGTYVVSIHFLMNVDHIPAIQCTYGLALWILGLRAPGHLQLCWDTCSATTITRDT